MEKNFICELYFHNAFLYYDKVWNTNNYMEDIQLISFTSFMTNQIDWVVTYKFVENSI